MPAANGLQTKQALSWMRQKNEIKIDEQTEYMINK